VAQEQLDGVLVDLTRWNRKSEPVLASWLHAGSLALAKNGARLTVHLPSWYDIHARIPFVEDGLRHRDIIRILEEHQLGLPDYYRWRSRSGCFFCFYQQRREWVGLLENHPDLFEKAKGFEKFDPETGLRYTWNQDMGLHELDLAHPEKIEKIREFRKNTGACISPFEAFLLLRGIKTLAIRMKEHCKNAQIMAEFLSQHRKISKVFFHDCSD